MILDAATGNQLTKHVRHPRRVASPQGYAGAGIWSTSAVDTETGYAYVGTSNPHNAQFEDAAGELDPQDRRRSRPRHLRRDRRQLQGPARHLRAPGRPTSRCATRARTPCYPRPASAPAACRLDLDFGASPTLYETGGRRLVGDLQKAGVFHAVDPRVDGQGVADRRRRAVPGLQRRVTGVGRWRRVHRRRAARADVPSRRRRAGRRSGPAR